MTEQPVTITRDRIQRVTGVLSAAEMESILTWLEDFLDL